MLFSDEFVYRNLGFRHAPKEEAAADKKALELLKSPPYSDKLGTPGLFLREVADCGSALSALLTPHLGNGFTGKKGAIDTNGYSHEIGAPVLDPNKPDQIAALPLGGRVKLNVWDDLELLKMLPASIISARDKCRWK